MDRDTDSDANRRFLLTNPDSPRSLLHMGASSPPHYHIQPSWPHPAAKEARMLTNPSPNALLESAEGCDLGTGKVVTLTKSHPVQYELFQTFLPDDDKYSNTIELYDAVPKYFANKTLMASKREGPEGQEKYLPTLERAFRYTDRTTGEEGVYVVEITPARVKDRNGNEKEYYPSGQEELVEEALRKIACDRLNGIYLNNAAGVQFTMYELRQELKRRGHDMRLSELIRSLTVCRRASIVIRKKGDKGEVYMDSAIFPTLIIARRKEWEENPKGTQCYVEFNPLVTRSINKLTYRQFDYVTFMQYRHQLSRWLHKRLFHNFTNADMLHPYSILLTTIVRDSGLVNSQRVNDRVKVVERALGELKDKDVIYGFEKDERRGKRNRLQDILYTLRPSHEFISEMKRANKRSYENAASRLR